MQLPVITYSFYKQDESVFDYKAHNKRIDKSITALYSAFNDIETNLNYSLQQLGQLGAKGALYKQYLTPLLQAIDAIDNMSGRT